METVQRLPRVMRGFAAPAAALTMLFAVSAAEANPQKWVREFWPEARAAGVSQEVYNRALSGFTPDDDVLARANRQAEFVRPIWEYLDSAVSESRLTNGRQMLATHSALLDRIEARYGVSRYIVVSIWGMESAYGAVLENKSIIKGTIRSLATLAYAGGKRQRYGKQQLIAALKILQRGDVTAAGMTGSWAGAMGHTQFIPTTYEAYAVDFDGDGKRNIWTSIPDALASTASYLNKSGWESGKTWGYEVVMPARFDYAHVDEGKARSLAQWQSLGIRRINGQGFPRGEDQATLLMPAGAGGPAFLMLKNFRVIKRYNNADAYALAVGHLADRLAGFEPIQGAWPRGEVQLSRSEIIELQQHLTNRGHYGDTLDGKIGPNSRAAIRAYQRSAGLASDGFASKALLDRLRAGR